MQNHRPTSPAGWGAAGTKTASKRFQRLATAAHPSAFELTPEKTVQFNLFLTSENVRLRPIFSYRRGFVDNPWFLFLSDGGDGRVLRFTYGKLNVHGTTTVPLRTWVRVTIVADVHPFSAMSSTTAVRLVSVSVPVRTA